MKKYRRVYLDVLSGDYHAKFIGDEIKSVLLSNDFPVGTLVINHQQNSTGVVIQTYDENFKEIYLNEFTIIDDNTIELLNTVPFTGHIKMMFFPTNSNTPTPLSSMESILLSSSPKTSLVDNATETPSHFIDNSSP